MKNKEEAPAGAGTPTEAMAEEKQTSFTNHNDYIANTGTVSKFLLHGRDNVLSTQTLITLTGLKTARELQQAIEAERKHGVPILTKPSGGYYLPSENTADAIRECRQFIHYMDSKGFGCLNSAKAARVFLVQLEQMAGGQQKMEL